MDKQSASEIINCLPSERSLYSYYKDYYALQLLKAFIGEGKKVSEIKKSRFGKLLNKPAVKKILSTCGGNRLCPEHFELPWRDSHHYYSLTLDLWNGNESGWSQTSRRGWNLVLQLNFSNQHNSQYRKLVKPDEHQVLNYFGHPVFRRNRDQYFRETLAWARLDIDFDKNECLIEEIQSDWIRDAKNLLFDTRLAKKNRKENIDFWPVAGRVDDIIRYCKMLDRQYGNVWAEAMLSAVLYFVNSELGIRQIYYHTARSGAQIKNITCWKPPKSLYSTLPRSFCFEETEHGPEMLLGDTRYKRLRRKLKQVFWYEMSF